MAMELDPVFLSRLQFGFVISFHIIFPSFTIGLAAVLKCEGAPRGWARARSPWLATAVLVVLALAFVVALFDRERIGTGLADRLWGLVFPALGLLAIGGVFMGVRWRRDGMPFAMTVLFFMAAFLTLAVLFWPFMIPYQVTVANAAAPRHRCRSCPGVRSSSYR
jgi:cytochrome bd-type quinol oxidase subunit 2